MDLADESGIESVTMRELGRRLEIEIPSGDVDWKEAMRRRAVSARGVFLQHRWAAGLIDSRTWSGPYSLSYADRVLGTLIQAGFSPATASWAFIVLDSYIYGFERQRANFSPSEDVDTIEVAQEVLAAIPQGEYSSLALVAMEYSAEPYDEDAAFEFGLGLILDGLQRLLG
jgi:hypothetical protein